MHKQTAVLKKHDILNVLNSATKNNCRLTEAHQKKVALVKSGYLPEKKEIEKIIQENPHISIRGIENHIDSSGFKYGVELLKSCHIIRRCVEWLAQCMFDFDRELSPDLQSCRDFTRLIYKDCGPYRGLKHKKIPIGCLVVALIYLEVPWIYEIESHGAFYYDRIYFAYSKECKFISAALQSVLDNRGIAYV